MPRLAAMLAFLGAVAAFTHADAQASLIPALKVGGYVLFGPAANGVMLGLGALGIAGLWLIGRWARRQLDLQGPKGSSRPA